MDILNKDLFYKIKTIALLATRYIELCTDGPEEFTIYKLILNCHKKFYEIEFKTNEHLIISSPNVQQIFNINEYLKDAKKKRCELQVPNNSDVNRRYSNTTHTLDGQGFQYDVLENEIIMFDERYFQLAKNIKI